MVLGWAAAIIVTFVLAVSTWYTSYTLWQYCMKHPRKLASARLAEGLLTSDDGLVKLRMVVQMSATLSILLYS